MPVNMVSMPDKVTTKKDHFFNRDNMTALGLLAGAALAIPTGGMSLAAAGAMAGGAATGAGLGSIIGGFTDRTKQEVQKGASAAGIQNNGQSKAIARRLESIAADNGSTANYDKLIAAEQATAKLPESQRAEYQPVLTQARLMEEQRLKNYYQQYS